MYRMKDKKVRIAAFKLHPYDKTYNDNVHQLSSFIMDIDGVSSYINTFFPYLYLN